MLGVREGAWVSGPTLLSQRGQAQFSAGACLGAPETQGGSIRTSWKRLPQKPQRWPVPPSTGIVTVPPLNSCSELWWAPTDPPGPVRQRAVPLCQHLNQFLCCQAALLESSDAQRVAGKNSVAPPLTTQGLGAGVLSL